mmetsp:Transcript_31493/g.75236  ORF Transcript_31493/g.75236 Transcript_31493/m.75236 type:complete len:258 (+) Transcript_31493:228-1001(+)
MSATELPSTTGDSHNTFNIHAGAFTNCENCTVVLGGAPPAAGKNALPLPRAVVSPPGGHAEEVCAQSLSQIPELTLGKTHKAKDTKPCPTRSEDTTQLQPEGGKKRKARADAAAPQVQPRAVSATKAAFAMSGLGGSPSQIIANLGGCNTSAYDEPITAPGPKDVLLQSDDFGEKNIMRVLKNSNGFVAMLKKGMLVTYHLNANAKSYVKKRLALAAFVAYELDGGRIIEESDEGSSSSRRLVMLSASTTDLGTGPW